MLTLLQIVVRSMFYVFITWHRFAPDGTGRTGRLSGQGGGHAKRGA